MTTYHVITKYTAVTTLCGLSRQHDTGIHIYDLKSHKGVCLECLDLAALRDLSNTDLGDEGAQGHRCYLCGKKAQYVNTASAKRALTYTCGRWDCENPP